MITRIQILSLQKTIKHDQDKMFEIWLNHFFK